MPDSPQETRYSNTDTDLVCVLIIIDQTFAVTAEVLSIALEVRIVQERKTSAQFHSTLAESGFEIVARHQAEFVLAPLVYSTQLVVPHKVSNIWIVIIITFREPVPGLKSQDEIPAFGDQVCVYTIPAVGQCAAVTVRLVDDADLIGRV